MWAGTGREKTQETKVNNMQIQYLRQSRKVTEDGSVELKHRKVHRVKRAVRRVKWAGNCQVQHTRLRNWGFISDTVGRSWKSSRVA